jgi:hypothetical protein
VGGHPTRSGVNTANHGLEVLKEHWVSTKYLFQDDSRP